MTEEIINTDGSRNWQANILLDNIKRLEQENKELKELKCKFKEYCTCDTENYRSALEEIKELAKNGNAIDGIRLKIIDKINEVLE